ncbi:hypothetical protein RCC89_12800 [Cytophagaceae bacterium ABcell3]|nr:hypothetical protein RCC89_12800 [Cytophagaceae bacterium ABcell3]
MKLFASICTAILLSFQVMAQQGAVTNAILYQRDGELDKAVSEIEKAIDHEKTKEKAETWYYRGVIYQSIAYSEGEAFESFKEGAPEKALKSFQKAMELDTKKKKYYKQSSEKLSNLYPAFINQGYALYEAGKYEQAVSSFENAQLTNPKDTTGYVYAMYAAEQVQEYDKIKKYIRDLKEIDYSSPYLYYTLVRITNNVDKNPEEAIRISQKALEEFPGNSNLLEQQTNILIAEDRKEEAIENLEALYKNDKNNVTVLTQLGVLYDQSGEKDKGLSFYEKVLEHEPEHYIANFNSAVIYYEKGVKSLEKQQDLRGKEKSEEYKTVKAQGEKDFKASLGYAKVAAKKAEDPEDKKNIQLLISEINKVLSQP